MDDNKKEGGATPSFTGPTHGPQGVDKAPGEEESNDTVQFEQITQKGKKDDGDPDVDADQPVQQDELDEENK